MNEAIKQQLTDVGAIVTDSHFIYTSGRHGAVYVNKDAIYPHTHLTSQLSQLLAQRCQHLAVDVVVAPVVGGVILSQWLAYHLTCLGQREVLAVYAEKAEDDHGKPGFVLRRGYQALVSHQNVLVVEDVMNTGGSVVKVIEAVKAAQGKVLAVAALCNRGGVSAEQLQVPMVTALLDMPLETWDQSTCPLCARAVPFHPNLGKARS